MKTQNQIGPYVVQASRKLPPHQRRPVDGRGSNSVRQKRQDFHGDLVAFQRHFLGGLQKDVEAVATGGGTRSINVAFETVLQEFIRGLSVASRIQWKPAPGRGTS